MHRTPPINMRLLNLVITASVLVSAAALSQSPASGSQVEQSAAASQTLRDIRFSGNHRFSALQLGQLIGLKTGDIASTPAIDAALSRIVAAYRSLGADLAVRAEISLADSGHCHLIFVLDEHGTGGSTGTAVRSGERMGGAPPPPPPATRQ